jgi:hypothetical protein
LQIRWNQPAERLDHLGQRLELVVDRTGARIRRPPARGWGLLVLGRPIAGARGGRVLSRAIPGRAILGPRGRLISRRSIISRCGTRNRARAHSDRRPRCLGDQSFGCVCGTVEPLLQASQCFSRITVVWIH